MMAPTKRLTNRQAEVLGYICYARAKTLRSPSHKEICERFGWVSVNTSWCHLKALEKKGAIRFGSHGSKNTITAIGQLSEFPSTLITQSGVELVQVPIR